MIRKLSLAYDSISSRPISALLSALLRKYREAINMIRQLPAIPPSVAQAKRAASRNKQTPKLVIFVCQHPRGREAKLAYGLRSVGWDVVLLYAKEANWDVNPYFSETRRYNNEWEALSMASEYSPQAYHVFSLLADRTAYTFVRHKPGKVIFDPNDMIEGNLNNPWLGREIKRQRYCIENADGLCCRDIQLQYVSRTFNYDRPEKIIYFPEYCWNFSEENPNQREGSESDGISVVLAGNFGIEKRGEGHWGYLDIAKKLASQKIHFHIYPHWFWYFVSKEAFEDTFSDYIALSKRTEYFHLHKPLPMEDVIPELRKYTVGINIARAVTFGEVDKIKNQNPEIYRYCGSARVSDYLDAGLPVISNRELTFQFFTLSRYGVVIDGTLDFFENAGERLQRLISPESKDKIRRGRSSYSIQNNIHRLTSFYESL